MEKDMKIVAFLALFLIINPFIPMDWLDFNEPLIKTNSAYFSIPSAWAADSVPGVQAEPSLYVSDSSDEYVIGQGDVLEVVVWRNEQLSRKVVVRPDGKISLPLLQDIQAAGSTALQLRNRILLMYSDYIDHPKVTVIVTQITSFRVSVLGRVLRPGVYPISGETTLVEAIALAGGFTEWANKGKITVVTNEEGKEKKRTVNYNKIASGKDPSQNIILKRGDIVVVP